MTDATSRPLVPTDWGRIVLWSVPFLTLSLAQALAIRVVAYEAFDTDGPSMEPTLVDGDRFVVDKGAFGLTLPFVDAQLAHWADPRPGDVVVLRSPADGVDIVKRVIGVAGDRITIEDDAVYVNGAGLRTGASGVCDASSDDEGPSDCEWVEEELGGRTWRTSHSLLTPPESMDEIVVPEGAVFVLGDHRDRSNDSRNPRVGCVPVSRVRGPALVIYWSEQAGRAGTWLP